MFKLSYNRCLFLFMNENEDDSSDDNEGADTENNYRQLWSNI